LVGLYNFSNEVSGAFALVTHAITYILFILSTIFMTYFINKKQRSRKLPVADFITVFKAKTSEL
ncbi:MAG: hypothetical protein OQJ77_08080, partial [Thiovulaceae bacterium]|nr:hypothetical protein [Sulfurimonadaceae bacterium]